MSGNKKRNKPKLSFSTLTIDSSLGHLAYGHLAFKVWREIKKNNAANIGYEKE